MSVKPLFYQVQDLGKYMKSTKKKYIWRFEVSNKEHKIELEHSLLSGKRKIFEDGKVLFEGTQVLGAAFQFPFSVDGNNLNIIQQGETFELRINNQVFTHLWQQEKTRSEFQYEDDIQKKEKNDNNFSNNNNEKWNFDTFGQEKKSEELQNDKKSQNEKKIRFSVNLDFGKKETQKKVEDNKFTIPPPTNFDNSTSNQNNFSTDFSKFSKVDQKKTADFDFNSFDFGKFGQQSLSPQTKTLSNESQPENKFPQTDFASLGKFSIAPLKKPPNSSNVMTQSMKISSPSKNIDLLDLVEEVPLKLENKDENNKKTVGDWDPFSQEQKNVSSPNLVNTTNSVQNPTPQQNQEPQLCDLVFTDQLTTPKNEEKSNPSSNLQDVFTGNPKQKEAEERFKKMTLLDNAFGSSYNGATRPAANNMMMAPNVQNMNMMNYYKQQGFYNMNMNPSMIAQNNLMYGINPNLANAGVFNAVNPNNNFNNNIPATPFDQFK